ncbi:hypothetical protein BDBG_17883, partial [Blastomyces gilchristii SLH14081]
SSHVDRSVFTDDCNFNVKLLIKNLRDIIIKKLSVSYVTKSSIFSSILSVSFSAALFQSSISVSVSDSLTSTISVPVILTSTTSAFSVSIISTFIISSLCFKKILYRLNESHFLLIASVSEIILIKDNHTAETTLFHSQASSITFSFFSAEKIVYTSDYK